MKPIGYFTSCDQGQAFVREFGDGDLARLPETDQAGLMVALSGLALNNIQGLPLSLGESANDFVLAFDCYDVTEAFHDSIAILDGVSRNDAIAIIHFLTQ